MVTITFDKTATVQLLQKVQKGMQDMRPFFSKVEPIVQKAKEQQFSSAGSYLAERWAPRKGGGAWPLLNKTGKMKGSFKTKSKTNDQMVYGSSSNYYKYHQLGTRKMPARVILNINTRLSGIVHKEFKAYIDKLLR